MGLESVIEGQCPTCGSPLERRDDCGWCPSCKVGHSLAGDTYTMHMVFDAEKFDGAFSPSRSFRPTGPVSMKITNKMPSAEDVDRMAEEFRRLA